MLALFALLLLLLLLLSLTYSILVALTQTLYYTEIDLTNILPGVYYIFLLPAPAPALKPLAFSTVNPDGEDGADADAGRDYVCYGNNFNILQLDIHTCNAHTHTHKYLCMSGEPLPKSL